VTAITAQRGVEISDINGRRDAKCRSAGHDLDNARRLARLALSAHL